MLIKYNNIVCTSKLIAFVYMQHDRPRFSELTKLCQAAAYCVSYNKALKQSSNFLAAKCSSYRQATHYHFVNSRVHNPGLV